MSLFQDDSLIDIDARLVELQAKLDEMEDVDGDRLIERLRRENPGHPVLMANTLSGAVAGMLVLASLATLAAPLVHAEFTKQLATIDKMIGLPVPLVLLALAGCTLVVTFATWQVAQLRGGSSPMLPAEAQEHQQLTNDIVRLKTKQEVQARLEGKQRNPMLGL